jgi:hypothetical protein
VVRFPLQFRQHDPRLLLLFSCLVFVAGFARLVALEEENLAKAFIGIDLGRQGSTVGNLKRDKAFPLGLKRRYVYDDAAAGVGGFADADSVADLIGDKRESGDIGDKKPESRNAGPTDANLRDKEKSKPAEGAQASPADGKMDKSQEQSEVEAARDQREPKSESAHHPSEVTSELAKQEAAEPAAQLESKEKKSDQEAA